jgi:integrase/recombinase XerD
MRVDPFRGLFLRLEALARHQNGPLLEERRRYLGHCAELQMSRRHWRSIAKYVLAVAEALRLADWPGEFITRGCDD